MDEMRTGDPGREKKKNFPLLPPTGQKDRDEEMPTSEGDRRGPSSSEDRGGGSGGTIGGRGGGRGGDSHRLTPQNTVPLPKAIFDPPNRVKGKIFRASPSLRLKKSRKF